MLRRTASRSLTTSCPATSARPLVGLASVHSMLIVVVLPAPLGPRKPKTSPGATSKLTPRTAATSSKFLRKCSTSITGGRNLQQVEFFIHGNILPMAASTGLRARKKQQRREDIARAAMKLFTERGFDAVTVAEVAEAAGVSEKTVFNYFPAKEDLVFPEGEARWEALRESIRTRPAGASLVAPFRQATHELLDQVASGHVEQIVARPRLVMASAALRGRLFVWWEQEAALLAPVI